jgi:hypothetical protein
VARRKGSGLNHHGDDGEAQGIASRGDSSTPSLPSTQYDYDSIKLLAQELGRPARTLIALAPQNDPFYITPGRLAAAQWFTKIWKRLLLGTVAHIRRVHYVLVSQKRPPLNVYGKPYRNTDDNWSDLLKASRDARLLGLVSASAFVDRRNDEPLIYLPNNAEQAWLCTLGRKPSVEIASIEMPDLPALYLHPPTILQRYHIEIWCEKTTVNDVLEPLARQNGCNLITGSGELSLTACELVVERAIASGRPVIILYISDFDPAGMSMPVAVARKIEHRLRREKLDLNIQLRPIALTHEQCIEYRLPRTPLKETERRAARFQERFGEGATELDALEALHPGELRRIVETEIARYYDYDLDRTVEATTADIKAELERLNQRTHARHRGEIRRLRSEWGSIAKDYERQIAAWRERADPVWQAIAQQLEADSPDLNEIDWPEPAEGDEDPNPLFDSTRDYVEQIDRYKRFQDRPTTRKNGGAS